MDSCPSANVSPAEKTYVCCVFYFPADLGIWIFAVQPRERVRLHVAIDDSEVGSLRRACHERARPALAHVVELIAGASS